MTLRKNQASALSGTAGVGAQASEEGFAEYRREDPGEQQGLIATCKDSANEAKAEVVEKVTGSAHESV